MMENSGTWEYGLEIPKSSLHKEFKAAGFDEINEYYQLNYIGGSDYGI